MAYTTIDNIKLDMEEKVLIELSDDNGTGEVDENVVNRQIRKADDTIDVYMRGRYPVDEDVTTPEYIVTLSTQLSIYYLYQRKQRDVGNDSIQDIYDRSIALLKEIQKGEATPFEPVDEPKVLVTNKDSTSKTFTKSVLDRML